MKKILVIYPLIIAVLSAYGAQPVKQGVTGKVYLRRGNYMPAPGHAINSGNPVSCNVFVYDLTTSQQATNNGIYYTNIHTKLIATGKSNNAGFYAISLPPGRYSVFVDDGGQLYANSFDSKGNINPVEVKKDSMSSLDIIINSQAVY